MRSIALATVTLLFIVSASFAKGPDQNKREEIKVRESNGSVLGVVVGNLDPEAQKASGLQKGALVLKVMEYSPAEEIGLQEDDIIVTFNGHTISNAEDLKEQVEESDADEDIPIVFKHKGKTVRTTVRLKKMKSGEMNIPGPDFDYNNLPRLRQMLGRIGTSDKGAYLGVETIDLSDQLKKYFSVDHGVLIEEVEEDSPAEEAGLKAGDVILQIGTKKIEDYGDLVRVLNYYDAGDQVQIKFSRKGRVKTITVKLEKKPHDLQRFFPKQGAHGIPPWIEELFKQRFHHKGRFEVFPRPRFIQDNEVEEFIL